MKSFQEFIFESFSCELMNDKDLESSANTKNFSSEDSLIAYLKKGGYKGKIQVNTIKNKEITNSKTVEI